MSSTTFKINAFKIWNLILRNIVEDHGRETGTKESK